MQIQYMGERGYDFVSIAHSITSKWFWRASAGAPVTTEPSSFFLFSFLSFSLFKICLASLDYALLISPMGIVHWTLTKMIANYIKTYYFRILCVFFISKKSNNARLARILFKQKQPLLTCPNYNSLSWPSYIWFYVQKNLQEFMSTSWVNGLIS